MSEGAEERPPRLKQFERQTLRSRAPLAQVSDSERCHRRSELTFLPCPPQGRPVGPLSCTSDAVTRGRTAENVLPCPGVLRTATRPPCASTISLVSASPTPVPWCRFAALASSC